MLDIFSSSKATPVDDSLPSQDAVAQALGCFVKDCTGTSHRLSSLASSHKRTILIFVRHNNCGMCMEYIRSCSNNKVLRSAAAATGESKGGGARVIVIGHGTHEGIARYKEMSGCAFDMYSDEDKNVYKALGLTRRFLGSTEDTKRASYIGEGKSSLSITAYSAYKMIASGSLAFKGGDFALLGGEFVLGEDSRCVFAHRMRDTTDHTQVEELAKYADIDRKE